MAKEIEKVREETKRIPLGDILVDHNWNSRGSAWRNIATPTADGQPQEGPEGKLGFPGLIESIKSAGQDTAVDVRPNPTKSRHPWMLVTGHRRFEALMRIAEQGIAAPNFDPRNPTILANIRNLTEDEAVAKNGRENLDREDLTTADKAFLVHRMVTDQKKTQVEVAAQFGLSQPYVGKLARIMKDTNRKILDKWRSDPVDPLTVEERIKLTETPKDEQEAVFTKMVEGSSKGKKGAGATGWMGKAKEQAESIGFFLGGLHRLGIANVDVGKLAANVKALGDSDFLTLGGKKGATENQLADLAKAIQAGFDKGLTPPAPPSDAKAADKAAQ